MLKIVASFLRNLLKNEGYYPKKCQGNNHIGKIITPTLYRRAILNSKAPCECGFYKNTSDFMKKQCQELEKTLENKK